MYLYQWSESSPDEGADDYCTGKGLPTQAEENAETEALSPGSCQARASKGCYKGTARSKDMTFFGLYHASFSLSFCPPLFILIFFLSPLLVYHLTCTINLILRSLSILSLLYYFLFTKKKKKALTAKT